MLAEDEADGRDWAEDELGAVALGDARLTSRLVALARSLARAPDTSLPQALPVVFDSDIRQDLTRSVRRQIDILDGQYGING